MKDLILRCEVSNDPINVRTFKTKTGQDMELREQTIYVFNGHAYPTRMRITLGRDQQPYKPGQYAIAPRSVVADQYGGPSFGRSIDLVPLDAAALKAA